MDGVTLEKPTVEKTEDDDVTDIATHVTSAHNDVNSTASLLQQETRRLVFNGKVPVCVQLATCAEERHEETQATAHSACSIELSPMQPSKAAPIADLNDLAKRFEFPLKIYPLYMIVHRIHYLSLLIPHLRRHFHMEDQDQVWFSCNGVPIKWQYPIGLLYDMYATDGVGTVWRITAHTTSLPSHIYNLSKKEDIDKHHMFLIKETDFLRNKSVRRTMSLSISEQQIMMQGFTDGDFETFWSVYQEIVKGDFKYIPVRIYRGDIFYQDLITSTMDGSSEFVAFISVERKTSVGDAVDIIMGCKTEESIVCHGVVVARDTVLLDVYNGMLYTDGYLHLIFK